MTITKSHIGNSSNRETLADYEGERGHDKKQRIPTLTAVFYIINSISYTLHPSFLSYISIIDSYQPLSPVVKHTHTYGETQPPSRNRAICCNYCLTLQKRKPEKYNNDG
jgi:hypothetical protein